MATRRVGPLDAAWLLLESRDTPMHVGALLEFTPPPDAPADFLQQWLQRARGGDPIPPWNLVPVARLPLLRETDDIDLDHHVRLWALPQPATQRELGVMVSWLHGKQLDLHRPLWEIHLIEGLDGRRFAIYLKVHHTLIDGVSAMRMFAKTLSADPADKAAPAFWSVGSTGLRAAGSQGEPGRFDGVRRAKTALGGLVSAVRELRGGEVDGLPLRAPFDVPDSPLGEPIRGQRRFATQQYSLELIKQLAKAGNCTLNDIVLYLCGTALRSYLSEYATVPERPLTAGIPVGLREEGDERIGTAIGCVVAELGTHIAEPAERLAAIARSTDAAKRHLRGLPAETLAIQTVAVNGPYIGGLLAGMRRRAPIPFSVGVSNVPGPAEPRYLSGARLDGMYPISMLFHRNALNITCVSYADTLNFGFVGARDTLPHLQRLAVHMGTAVDEISRVLLPATSQP